MVAVGQYPDAVPMVFAVSFQRCGRLSYLHPGPMSPQVGDKVLYPTTDGNEVVVGHDVPREQVVVRLSGSGSRCACSRADVCVPRAAHDQTYPNAADTATTTT